MLNRARKVDVDVLNRRKSPKIDAIFHITTCRDKVGLDVKYINPLKGRGVFAVSAFTKGQFVVEFRGQRINSEESHRRHRIYHKHLKAFMFDFLWRGKFWTIDAARDDGTLGRLVNDDHVNPNCKMKRILVDGKPHLCLFALRDIAHGEEITYKYSYSECPWRTQAAKCGRDASTNRLESDGSSVNDPPYTKCSQHKSPSHIQGQARSKALISSKLPCVKLKKQLLNIGLFDSTHVCLQRIREVEKPNDINASFLDSYRLQKASIATQDPLTTEKFCRMLWEHNFITRVNLSNLEMEQETCHQYWPAECSARYQYFAVDAMAKYRMPRYILRDATDGQSWMIRQFRFTDWPEQGMLFTGETFNNFIVQVKKTKVPSDQDGPITLHCSMRAGRTGVLITFSIVLKRMRSEGVVDLFQMVNTVNSETCSGAN